MTKGEKRIVRTPATKFAHLRKKLDQRKLRSKPAKGISRAPSRPQPE